MIIFTFSFRCLLFYRFFFLRYVFHKFYNLWFFKKNLIDKQFYWFYLLRFKRRVLQSYVYITFVYIYIKSDSMYLAMKQSHGLIFFIGILKNLDCLYIKPSMKNSSLHSPNTLKTLYFNLDTKYLKSAEISEVWLVKIRSLHLNVNENVSL